MSGMRNTEIDHEYRGASPVALRAPVALANRPRAVVTSEIAMRFEEHITVTPGVRSGKPCIKGTRITVYDILEYLAGGMTEEQIVKDFPSLKPEHIRAALAFAAARERRERHLRASGGG